MKNILSVMINSPEKVIWQGTAYSVSSKNSEGPFDVLPHHANFLTIIEKDPIIIRTGGKVVQFSFPISLMYAHDNYVYAYTL